MTAGMAGIRTATMYLTAEEIGRGKEKNVTWISNDLSIASVNYLLGYIYAKDIGKTKFRKIKNILYLSKTNGFYVYTPKSQFKSYIELIKYVTRYVSRPVMAESRIIDYDGTYVTFWYQRHEDDKVVIEKIHAYEFISRLIIHIPEPNFKYIRFYGAYCNTSKCHKSFIKLFNEKSIELKNILNKWRNKIIVNFNVDPLICPICKTNMLYLKSNYF